MKISVISIGNKPQELLILLWFSAHIFIMKGNAKFQLEVSENEDVIVFLCNLRIPLNSLNSWKKA